MLAGLHSAGDRPLGFLRTRQSLHHPSNPSPLFGTQEHLVAICPFECVLSVDHFSWQLPGRPCTLGTV